jgi:outer membrane protein assembly factor BamB
MVLGASAPIFPADWPQHLGPERNAKSQESGFSWRTGKWGTIWTREAGEGFSAPVVFGGSIFLFHRQDGQEIIESLDQATGKTRWRSNYRTTYRDDFGFDEGPRAAPLATFDAVFTYGAEGTMTATQTATGKRLWQRNPMRELSAPKGYFGAASSPLLAAGKLIAAIGGPGGAGIVAFDLNSGKEVWRALDDEAGYSSPVAANIRGKTLLASTPATGPSRSNSDGARVRRRRSTRPRRWFMAIRYFSPPATAQAPCSWTSVLASRRLFGPMTIP